MTVQLDLFGDVERAERQAASEDRQRRRDALTCLRDSMPETLEAVAWVKYRRERDTRHPGMCGDWAYVMCRAGIRFEHVSTWGGWDCTPRHLLTWAELDTIIGSDARRAAVRDWVSTLVEPCWRELMRPHEMWPNRDQWHPSYITGDHDRAGWTSRRQTWMDTLAILTDAIERLNATQHQNAEPVIPRNH